jgi:hypothetical protein
VGSLTQTPTFDGVLTTPVSSSKRASISSRASEKGRYISMSLVAEHRAMKTDTGESVHDVARRLVKPKYWWLIDPRKSRRIGYWDSLTSVRGSRPKSPHHTLTR